MEQPRPSAPSRRWGRIGVVTQRHRSHGPGCRRRRGPVAQRQPGPGHDRSGTVRRPAEDGAGPPPDGRSPGLPDARPARAGWPQRLRRAWPGSARRTALRSRPGLRPGQGFGQAAARDAAPPHRAAGPAGDHGHGRQRLHRVPGDRRWLDPRRGHHQRGHQPGRPGHHARRPRGGRHHPSRPDPECRRQLHGHGHRGPAGRDHGHRGDRRRDRLHGHPGRRHGGHGPGQRCHRGGSPDAGTATGLDGLAVGARAAAKGVRAADGSIDATVVAAERARPPCPPNPPPARRRRHRSPGLGPGACRTRQHQPSARAARRGLIRSWPHGSSVRRAGRPAGSGRHPDARRRRPGAGTITAAKMRAQHAGTHRQPDGGVQRCRRQQATDGGADGIAQEVEGHRDRERAAQHRRVGPPLAHREQADVHGSVQQPVEDQRQRTVPPRPGRCPRGRPPAASAAPRDP